MKRSLPLFLAAEGFSLFGNSAISIVLPWLILARTGDPALAGLISMVTAIPAFIAALVGGHLIDRLGRRRMSVLADCGSAASVAALAVVDHSFGLGVGWFIALGLLGALFDVPGMTARETLMASVAQASGVALDKVAGYRQTVFGVSFLAGPALAGVLMSLLDPIHVVWITAACSALAALATAVMPLAPSPSQPALNDGGALAGWALIRGNPGLVALIVVGFASTIPVAPLLAVLLPAHFEGMDAPGLLGVTTSSFAVGTIVGSLAYAGGLSRWRWRSWVLAVGLFTAGFALMAPLQGFWMVAAGMTTAGVGSGLMGPLCAIGMTENVPEHQRGRVFGLFNALSMMSAPLGLGMIALLLTRWPLAVGGWALVVVWILVALYSVLSRHLRSFVQPERVSRVDDREIGAAARNQYADDSPLPPGGVAGRA